MQKTRPQEKAVLMTLTLLTAISLILLSKTALGYDVGDDQNGVIGIVSLFITLFVFSICWKWFFRGISIMRQRHDTLLIILYLVVLTPIAICHIILVGRANNAPLDRAQH